MKLYQKNYQEDKKWTAYNMEFAKSDFVTVFALAKTAPIASRASDFANSSALDETFGEVVFFTSKIKIDKRLHGLSLSLMSFFQEKFIHDSNIRDTSIKNGSLIVKPYKTWHNFYKYQFLASFTLKVVKRSDRKFLTINYNYLFTLIFYGGLALGFWIISLFQPLVSFFVLPLVGMFVLAILSLLVFRIPIIKRDMVELLVEFKESKEI